MTTVVAYAANGNVWMAADTCTNVYERPIIGGASKLLRVKAGDGEILLGFCGAGGLPGDIATSLKVDAAPADPEGDDVQAWAHSVAKACTEIAVTGGFVENGKLDGTMILGWGGRLWTVAHGMAIPHPDGVAAVGSGEGPAIGALDMLVKMWSSNVISYNPLAWVDWAAQVGIARDRYSAGPVDVAMLGRALPAMAGDLG